MHGRTCTKTIRLFQEEFGKYSNKFSEVRKKTKRIPLITELNQSPGEGGGQLFAPPTKSEQRWTDILAADLKCVAIRDYNRRVVFINCQARWKEVFRIVGGSSTELRPNYRSGRVNNNLFFHLMLHIKNRRIRYRVWQQPVEQSEVDWKFESGSQ